MDTKVVFETASLGIVPATDIRTAIERFNRAIAQAISQGWFCNENTQARTETHSKTFTIYITLHRYTQPEHQ